MKELLRLTGEAIAIFLGYGLLVLSVLYFLSICVSYPLIGIPLIIGMSVLLFISMTKAGRELL